MADGQWIYFLQLVQARGYDDLPDVAMDSLLSAKKCLFLKKKQQQRKLVFASQTISFLGKN